MAQEEGSSSTADEDPPTESQDVEALRCGLGCWSPDWLQTLASSKAFLLVHGLIALLEITINSYFGSTISTLEKRFRLPSIISGLVAAGLDIGVLLSLVLLSYPSSRGHKPRWLAAGGALMALSCVVRYVLHLATGPGEDALRLTAEYGATPLLDGGLANGSSSHSSPLCAPSPPATEPAAPGGGPRAPSAPAAAVLLLGQVMLGVGSSVYFTLGLAYLDDNVTKDKAPIMLALSQILRMLGPTIGYMAGTLVLRQYVAPELTPVISQEDPRWIGAWWMAWPGLAVVTAALSLGIALFPRELPATAARRPAGTAPPKTEISFTDYYLTMKRLLTNPVLMCNTFSGVFFMFGSIGFWTFMGKYLETQFRRTAADASFIQGCIGLVFTSLGVLCSALVISWFKPRARSLAAWNIAVELFDIAGRLSLALIGCPFKVQGSWNQDGRWNMTSPCNRDCGCEQWPLKLSPVCGDSALTFFSACQAGCRAASTVNGTTVYSDCACVEGGLAVEGSCPLDCTSSFTLFLAMQCILQFFEASGRAGNMLLHFRCISEADKPIALAFVEVMTCALAYIPGPIAFGFLLDSTCSVWGDGNCWLYDGLQLRTMPSYTSAGFLVVGLALDVGVWYYVKNLQLYDEDNGEQDPRTCKRSRLAVLMAGT